MKEVFPERYSVLLIGPPGVGKREFCLDLVHYYLKKGEKVVFLTTEMSPEDLEKSGKAIGAEFSTYASNLYYVDCYSWSLRQVPRSTTQKHNVIRITNPENLNEIIVKAERIMGIFGSKVRVVFHSLSPLFLYNEAKDVIKFVQLFTTRVKEDGSFIFATAQEGVHSPSTVNTLKYLMDGVMEMRFHEEKGLERQIRPHHLKDIPADSTWKPFTIDKKGFIIKE
ncbi:MAG: RAD55 family ATPase [Candidatus Hydrothermarchaeales archaeon]